MPPNSALKMETVYRSDTSVSTYQTLRDTVCGSFDQGKIIVVKLETRRMPSSGMWSHVDLV
jgi:hypothetical protein